MNEILKILKKMKTPLSMALIIAIEDMRSAQNITRDDKLRNFLRESLHKIEDMLEDEALSLMADQTKNEAEVDFFTGKLR